MESSDPAAGRGSRRVATTADVRLEFERFSGFLQEMASNVSRGGMFVRTRSLRPPGSKLRFEISLSDDWPLVRGSGVVMWTRWRDGGEQQPAGMGIRFEELDAQSRDLVERLVTEQRKAGKSPFDLAAAAPAPEPAPVENATEETRSPVDRAAPEPVVTPPVAAMAEPALAPRPEVRPPDAEQGIEVPPPSPAREIAPVSPGPPVPNAASRAPRELLTLAQVVASVHRDLPSPPLEPSARKELVGSPAPAAAWVAPALQREALGAGQGPESRSNPSPSRRRMAAVAALAAGALLAALAIAWVVRPRRSVDAQPTEPVAIAPEGAGGHAEAGPRGADAAGDRAGAPSDTGSAAAAPSASRPVAPSAATAPAAFSAVERITWETVPGGTVVTLWLNAPAPAGTVLRSRIEAGGVRELLQLRGARSAFAPARLEVGTAEVVRIRTGFHSRAGGDEQHVVLDLASPAVRVTGVETRGSQVLVRVSSQ